MLGKAAAVIPGVDYGEAIRFAVSRLNAVVAAVCCGLVALVGASLAGEIAHVRAVERVGGHHLAPNSCLAAMLWRGPALGQSCRRDFINPNGVSRVCTAAIRRSVTFPPDFLTIGDEEAGLRDFKRPLNR